MLEIIFFTEANEIERCNVPENVYEKLAQTGFYDLSESFLEHLIIEDDEDYYEVFKLDEDNRKKYIDFLGQIWYNFDNIFLKGEFYEQKNIFYASFGYLTGGCDALVLVDRLQAGWRGICRYHRC